MDATRGSSTTRHGGFNPPPTERYKVPILQEVGQSQRPVLPRAENLSSIWLRNPNLPARTDFLTAYCYAGPLVTYNAKK